MNFPMKDVIIAVAPGSLMDKRKWQLLLVVMVMVIIGLNVQVLFLSGRVNRLEKNGVSYESCHRPVSVHFDTAVITADQAIQRWDDEASNNGKILSLPRNAQDLLVIGIPVRKHTDGDLHLKQTLQSLVKQSSARQQISTRVTLFLLDRDPNYNSKIVQLVTNNFMYYINIGFIEIVQVPNTYSEKYESTDRVEGPIIINGSSEMDKSLLTLDQAAGYTYMYEYVHHRNSSQYFLQLTDDVMCFADYISHIQIYIDMQFVKWSMLEFSQDFFMGSMFKTSELHELALMMRTFYRHIPASYIFPLFCMSEAQESRRIRQPELFHHIGSEEDIVVQNPINFKDLAKEVILEGEKWVADNPPARLSTNMHYDDKFPPVNSYSTNFGFFWAQDPKKEDWLAVAFNEDILLDRVRVETGSQLHPQEILHHGALESSPHTPRGAIVCMQYSVVEEFKGGLVDAKHLQTKIKGRQRCIRIRVTSDQNDWIVFNQILVFIQKPILL